MEEIKKKGRNKGITLVALVVTIVVLLILAGVTIALVMNNNSIIKRAMEARDDTTNAVDNEIAGLNNLGDVISIGLGEAIDIAKVTSTDHGTLKAEDTYGNIVTVPEDFKVVTKTEDETIISTGDIPTVPEGVVIQDSEGNQFVWIPVGKVYKSNNETDFVEIKLGRYDFSESETTIDEVITPAGTPTLVQPATNYKAETELRPNNWNSDDMDKYGKPAVLKELTTKRNGVASNGTEGLNATAKDLKGFVESVRSNGGYYLARYEASCEAIQGKTGIEYKLVSKVSKVKVMNYSFVKPEVGQIKLWNGIKQIDAALASREMYNDADRTIGVKSDLANSYAWDTAIVYIQKMGNANYANADRGSNTDLMNTGETGDVKCNIYDMAGNALEWTTEYSTGTDRWYAYTCVYRGGYCKSSDYRAAHRYGTNADNAHWCFSFRPTLYVK